MTYFENYDRRFWSDLGLAFLPGAIAFLSIPAELYLSNQSEFDYNVTILVPFIAIAVLWILISALVFKFLKPEIRSKIALGLLWLGFILLFSDIVAPVQLGLLDGEQDSPREPIRLTIQEVLVVACLALIALRAPVHYIRKFGILFVLIILTSVLARFVVQLPRLTHVNKSEDGRLSHASISSKPNVYHLTWDSYSSHTFKTKTKLQAFSKNFDGFCFFENNRSNYDYTMLSRASFMTGTYFDGQNLREWLFSENKSGIQQELYNAGFVIWNYVHSQGFVHKRASHVVTNIGLMTATNNIATLADLWLLRIAPNFLQQEIFHHGGGSVSRILSQRKKNDPMHGLPEQQARSYYSVELMKRLIEQERYRPPSGQYVHAHIYLPHAPMIMDENCTYSPQNADFYTQSSCADKLMVEFIAELKRLDRYDQSTIIFQSDHANYEVGSADPAKYSASLRNMNELQSNLLQEPPETIDNLSSSLLLIKPRNSGGKELEISQKPTQLIDLPATLYDLINLVPRHGVKEGKPIFSADLDTDRELHLYIGFRQKDKNGLPIFLGTDFKESEMNHFSYSILNGWKRYPNIQSKW